MKISIILYKIANGYLGILLKILFSLTIFSVTGLAAILVGYPLWILATHYTQIYNIFVPAIIISAFIAMLITKHVRTRKNSYRSDYPKFLRENLTKVLLISLRTFLSLILVFFLIFVLLNHSLIINLISVPLIIVAIGLTLFIK